MTRQRPGHVEALFHAALEREASERRVFLAEACKGDSSLLAEVEALIGALEEAPAYLEEPACGVLSEAVSADGDPGSDEDGTSLAGERVGVWELVDRIAEGGMGQVYLARRADGHYEKQVAIKLIKRGLGAEDPGQRSKMIRRFREELQHHANLDHPNVAKLLDGGTTPGGLPYLVMEYVEGRPVDAYCEDHGLLLPERLSLFRAICLAVQHAHSRFVAHCDIKPSNILVAPGPEPGDDPVPKLLDFGIAKLLKQDDNGRPQAAIGTRIRPMTPEYASPEQVRNEPITAASDVYSLGVVLYKLVTGRLPYDVTEYDAKQVICEQAPKRPSSTAPGITREVDTVVLKALEKEPSRRYASAAALAEDIERYLTGRPLLAHDQSPVYRFSKFLHRHRSRIVGVLLLVAAGIPIGVWIGQLSKTSERQRAEAKRSDAMFRIDSVGRRLHTEAIDLEARGDRLEAETKFGDAQSCFRLVLDLERNAPEGSGPVIAWLSAERKGLLGHCHLKLGKYRRAEVLLLESLSVTRAHFGDADRRTLQARRWLVELYESWGRPEKAEEYR